MGSGLVVSLAHPGGNFTGLTNEAGLEIFSKRVALLKEVAPRISRIGILANRSNTVEARTLEETEPTAPALRLTVLPVEVRGPSDFDGAFAVLIRERADALMATWNSLNLDHRGSIVSFAAVHRLPTAFGERAFVDEGGSMPYGISYADLLQRVPIYIDKILRSSSSVSDQRGRPCVSLGLTGCSMPSYSCQQLGKNQA